MKSRTWATSQLLVVGILLAIIGLLAGILIGRNGGGTTTQTAQQTATSTTAAPITAAPTTTTEVPTTTAPTTTTEAPLPTQAEAAGCVSSAPALAPDAWVGDGIMLDLDGFAGEEIAFAYTDPSTEIAHLRVESVDGSFASEVEIPASSAIGGVVFAAVDTNNDAAPELLARIDGGASAQILGFAVLENCSLELTRDVEGQVFGWTSGGTVSRSSGLACSAFDYVTFWSATRDDGQEGWSVELFFNELVGLVWEPAIVDGSSVFAYETEDAQLDLGNFGTCDALPATLVADD